MRKSHTVFLSADPGATVFFPKLRTLFLKLQLETPKYECLARLESFRVLGVVIRLQISRDDTKFLTIFPS